MGTTRDALQADSSVELGYVLVIEGYKYLITDGLPLDAVTAWAGSQWSDARTGLRVNGSLSQKLAPWSNELSVFGLTFTILGEEFAVDMFRSRPVIRTQLLDGFSSGDSQGGSFDINVQDASQFTDTLFIGNETFTIGSVLGDTITLSDEGQYHPHGADGTPNVLGTGHAVADDANVGNYSSSTPVYVTGDAATWLGKHVALHACRVSGGVWDTKGESEIIFAGTIDGISQDGPLGTRIECVGIRQSLIDATLMHDQWSATPSEGMVFVDGDWLGINLRSGAGGSVTYAYSERLTAATPGTGADEFPAGRYSAAEFGAILSDHLNGDATVGVAPLSRRWTCGTKETTSGSRFVISSDGTSLDTPQVELFASREQTLEFLGFEIRGGRDSFAYAVSLGPVNQDGLSVAYASDNRPVAYPDIGASLIPGGQHTALTIDLEDSDGKFFDHTSLLPPSAQEHVSPGEVWSFYTFGDEVVFLGRRDSDTKISGILTDIPLAKLSNNADKAGSLSGHVRVKQILFVADTFSNIMAKLFASIDGEGVNHGTYDAFPWGAGIPWSLLGSSFLNSLQSVEQASIEDSVALIIEKPTKLWDAVRSDFAMRMASPVWKDGGLQIQTLSIPNASTAEHILNESNKSDMENTTMSETSEYLTHTLKIQYNRNPIDDEYRDTIIVRNAAAYQRAGGRGETLTIKARNSYGGIEGSGASIEALADTLGSVHLPVFGKPLKVWSRSVPHTLFHTAPGDSVSISDDRTRDPNTGQLGISSRATTVLSVSSNLGISSDQGYFGQVDVLFSEEDRMFSLAPSLDSATQTTTATGRSWTDGYDDGAGTAGVFSLLVEQDSFSPAASNDVDSFAVTNLIRLLERDPSDPAAAVTFADSIDAINKDVIVGYDEIVLKTGFGNSGNPAFSAGALYTVEFDSYDQLTGDQLLTAFQASVSDGLIQNLINENVLGENTKLGDFAPDIDLLPLRHSDEQSGDGVPFSASFVRAQCRMGNNLANYKTAAHAPFVVENEIVASTAGASEFKHMWTFPFFVGSGRWPGGRRRRLNIAPMFRSTSGGTSVSVRVTSSANPPRGEVFTDTSWNGPISQVTFSSSSSTLAVATAQQLAVIRAQQPWPGDLTWISVETNNLTAFHGLAELWLGPIE